MIHPSAIKSNRPQPLEVPDATPPLSQPHKELMESKPVNTPVSASASVTHFHAASEAVGKIQVLNGSSSGRELVLNKALTTLGRTGVQVAVITKRPQGYFITHVEGKVLPIVNGVSTGAQAFALKDHDVIELAGVKMEFYLTHSSSI